MVKRLAGREQIAEPNNCADRCRSGDYRSSLHRFSPRNKSCSSKNRTTVFDVTGIRQFLSYFRPFVSRPHSKCHPLYASTPPRLPGVAELYDAQYCRPTDGARIVCQFCVPRSQIPHRILFFLSIRQHSESDRPVKTLTFHQ
jgi:hypothetical protein